MRGSPFLVLYFIAISLLGKLNSRRLLLRVNAMRPVAKKSKWTSYYKCYKNVNCNNAYFYKKTIAQEKNRVKDSVLNPTNFSNLHRCNYYMNTIKMSFQEARQQNKNSRTCHYISSLHLYSCKMTSKIQHSTPKTVINIRYNSS